MEEETIKAYIENQGKQKANEYFKIVEEKIAALVGFSDDFNQEKPGL